MIDDSVYEQGIDLLLSNINLSDVPLIGSIKVTKSTWGRVDKIINRYYQGQTKYLKLLLAFNNISDITEIRVGMTFECPDISYLEQFLYQNTVLDDARVAGVSASTDSAVVNASNPITQTGNKTTALPKLNITLKKVSYDPKTGNIVF